MPTAGAYLIAVFLTAPAMIKLGFPVLSVHMFIFYFSILSQLTPPVSLAVLVAISISKGNYGKTALNALRLAIPGFMMPLFFLYKPVMLALGENPLGAIQFNIFLLIGIWGLAIALEGYLTRKVSWIIRIFCLIGSSLIFHPKMIFSYLGGSIIVIIIISNLIRSKYLNKGIES
jgi:TRAP-type uncharacterized transport system fused permease subunit